MVVTSEPNESHAGPSNQSNHSRFDPLHHHHQLNDSNELTNGRKKKRRLSNFFHLFQTHIHLHQSNHNHSKHQRQQPSTSDIQSSLEQNRSSSIQEDSIINNEQNPHQSSVSVSDSNRTDFSSTNEIPLPSGWTQQLSETGRVFYIDHIHKTTTWIDPRTGKPSPSPKQPRLTSCNGGDNLRENNQSKGSNFDRKTAVDDLGPLPAGWEERVHRDGRIFFINHSKRR